MARGELEAAEQSWQYAADHLASEEGGEYLTWRVRALAGLAMTKGMLGDLDGATRCHERIVAICEARGEPWFSGFSLWTSGLGLWRHGEARAAAERLREGLTRVRRVNDTFATGYCVEALGWVAHDLGDPSGRPYCWARPAGSPRLWAPLRRSSRSCPPSTSCIWRASAPRSARPGSRRRSIAANGCRSTRASPTPWAGHGARRSRARGPGPLGDS